MSGLPVIYRDDAVIVLDKPTGLLAVPGRGPELQDCLSARVQLESPGALVVHRLDRDTSGVFVMALSPHVQRNLSRQFELRMVSKRYVAVVDGVLHNLSGRITLPLRKDFDRPPRHRVDQVCGRPSETQYRVLATEGGCSRLEIVPLTGRSHQIRVHLAALGHPILGDPLYADDRVQQLAPRLMLHAVQLQLTHPLTSEGVSWASCPPF